jgi:hypothetical protein
VLVLATLWPVFWGTLTACPAAGEDRHAQARELLAGQDIGVPAAFTPEQVQQLTDSGDPRLALAAAAGDERDLVPFGRVFGHRRAGADRLVVRMRVHEQQALSCH